MGLTLSYFYSLTPRTFYNTLKGHREKEELKFKNSWEQNRDLEFAIIKPHLSEKYQNITKQEYHPFPWDKQEEENAKPKPKKEAIKNTFKKWDELKFKEK